MRRAIIAAAIILVASPALAFYVYKDGNNVIQYMFDFSCPVAGAPGGTGHCNAQVLIDSSANEKGTPANPLVTATLGAPNITPTDCSGTVANGGAPQIVIAASSTIHGFSIGNIDATTGGGEPVWISFSGPATAGAPGSYPLGAPATPSYSGMGTYTTPAGFGPNAGVSIVAFTTAHAYSCTTW